MPGADMDLSVVIVNYKTPQLLVDCIASVKKETHRLSYEIIVVDNCSQDDSQSIVTQHFPDVIWVQMKSNNGFASGNNAGIKKAKGEYVLLLNSDTLVLDGALDKCVAYLKQQTDPTIKVLGCKLLNRDGSLQYSSFPRVVWPSISVTADKNIVLFKIKTLFKGHFKKDPNNAIIHRHIHIADSICGAFILFERGIIKKTGLLDPDFFMYFEEIEWAHRISQQGYKIVYYPEVSIVHFSQGSCMNMKVGKQVLFSEGLFILKYYGSAGYFLFLFLNYLNIITGFVLYPFLSREVKDKSNARRIRFMPLHPAHWRILFGYHRRLGSGKQPLRVT
jgi:GT2 family glycosyltransferase